MTHRDLNRAVARATGETVDCIQRLGFSPMIVPTYVPISKCKLAYGLRQLRTSGRRKMHAGYAPVTPS